MSKMNSAMKKILIILLIAMMSLCGMPSVAFAYTQGSTGNNYNVLVLCFDPVFEIAGNIRQHELMDSWTDPHELAAGYIADMKEISYGYANYDIVDWVEVDEIPRATDGTQYSTEEWYRTFEDALQDPDVPYWDYEGWLYYDFDYDYYLSKYDVYNRVNSGEIDEVWVFFAPCTFDSYETVMVGRDAYWCNSPGIVKDCRNFVVLMNNYEREVAEMLHCAGHRMESIMGEVAGWPDYDKDYEEYSDWEKFTAIDTVAPGKSGPGYVHFPPNGTSDYDWYNTNYVSSRCYDWRNYPNMTGETQVVNCDDWDADQRQFLKWWFSLMPHVEGMNPESGLLNNWWKYYTLDYLNYGISLEEELGKMGQQIPSGAVTLNGHSYHIYQKNAFSWDEINRFCELLGGHLAVVSSREESDFLSSLVMKKGMTDVIIGYTDADSEGDWKWVKEENGSYTNWDEGEPNNAYGNENYAMITENGNWNDAEYSVGVSFLCEWDYVSKSENQEDNNSRDEHKGDHGSIDEETRYIITYDANGGKGVPAGQTKVFNQETILSNDVPTRDGYIFLNWNTRQDGSGTTYAPGDRYTENGDVVLYAQWKNNNPSERELPFSDTAKGAWFYDSVKYVFDHEIMTGKTADYFGAAENLSRAQFATVLYRVAKPSGAAYVQKFPDVKETDWFGLPVSWASTAKVITGYTTGYFGPADDITREQIAAMLYRYADSCGYDTGRKADFSKYPDASKVSDWATEAMQWAVGEGIITGQGGVYLDPIGKATRAECATMVMRFMEKYWL